MTAHTHLRCIDKSTDKVIWEYPLESQRFNLKHVIDALEAYGSDSVDLNHSPSMRYSYSFCTPGPRLHCEGSNGVTWEKALQDLEQDDYCKKIVALLQDEQMAVEAVKVSNNVGNTFHYTLIP